MNEYTEYTTITFVQEDCCVCGVIFGMPKQFYEQRRRSGNEFYCPNGHRLVYTETEVDKLKKELERTKEKLSRERVALEQPGSGPGN